MGTKNFRTVNAVKMNGRAVTVYDGPIEEAKMVKSAKIKLTQRDGFISALVTFEVIEPQPPVVIDRETGQVDDYLLVAKGHIEQAIKALSEFDSTGGDLGYPWVRPYQKALQSVDRDLGLELADYYGIKKDED